MSRRNCSCRTRLNPIATVTLVVSWLWGGVFASGLDAAPTQAGGSQPAPRPSAVTAAGAPAVDPGWPRTYTTPTGGQVQIYQPQIASWDLQKRLVAYLAIAHRARSSEAPVLGTVKVEADTTVALEERLVRFTAFEITEASFGSVPRERTRAIVGDVSRAIPAFERVIGLDRVLAGIDTSRIVPKNVAGVKADPPTIFFSTSPAILLNFDGDPIWSSIPASDLMFAVNTNWDVFRHGPSKALLLRTGQSWLQANALAGPWAPAGSLPASFAGLPADENWSAVREALPGRPIKPNNTPTVFVSTSPAEAIVLSGAPNYVLVSAESELLWVSNTDSDVFRLGKSGPIYYLAAGRWFSAPSFNGPWMFATPTLPSDFRRISSTHPRARVLASVPGTPQAVEAVVLAQIPQTARVNKASLQAPHVTYVGAPQFQSIEQTSLQRAVNTDKDIIRVGDRYYLCFQGVWFVSSNAHGPWIVTTAVPPAIYSIPVSSPVHHVTYVTIVEQDAEWIVVSAAAGYSGVTVAWGCVVWGTGWAYPPYVWYGGPYPVYYPFAATYGYSAWYNPSSGTYGRSAVAYGPYGGVGATARYNPATGTYARGTAAWGPYGARGAAEAYNPRTGAYAQTRQGAGVYGSWGSTYVQRGDEWAHSARATNHLAGNTTRVTRTDDGGMVSSAGPAGGGFLAAGEEGMYAGRDGNVYRRAEDGGWQRYEDGAWGPTQHPGPAGAARDRAAAADPPDRSTIGQLERDRSARIEGGQRVRDYAAGSRGGRSGPPSGGRGALRGGRGR